MCNTHVLRPNSSAHTYVYIHVYIPNALSTFPTVYIHLDTLLYFTLLGTALYFTWDTTPPLASQYVNLL